MDDLMVGEASMVQKGRPNESSRIGGESLIHQSPLPLYMKWDHVMRAILGTIGVADPTPNVRNGVKSRCEVESSAKDSLGWGRFPGLR